MYQSVNNRCSITLWCRKGSLGDVRSLREEGGSEETNPSVNHMHNQFAVGTKTERAAVLPGKVTYKILVCFPHGANRGNFKTDVMTQICGCLHEPPMNV